MKSAQTSPSFRKRRKPKRCCAGSAVHRHLNRWNKVSPTCSMVSQITRTAYSIGAVLRQSHIPKHRRRWISAADGAVLRNRQGRLCPLGKGCSGSCCGVHKRTIPGYDRLLSAQCAPDAGFLAVVQRHAGTAWRSASLELDTERCDHGGRAARRGAPLVHPAGYSTESIQGGASANDRGFCVSGKCSRRKGRCVV